MEDFMEWGEGKGGIGRRNQGRDKWSGEEESNGMGGGIDDMGRREEWGGEIGVRGMVREKG